MVLKATLVLTMLLAAVNATELRGSARGLQPLYEGKVESDDNFAASAASDKPARPPGYRNAWDDCGGVGASATERMRSIAAGIKGWAKPLPFVRNAAQDCGTVDSAGTKPGPGSGLVYPGPEITKAGEDAQLTASDALDKYGPTEPPPPRESIYVMKKSEVPQ